MHGTTTEMLTWALGELDQHRQDLQTSRAEAAELRRCAVSSGASWQAEDASHRAEVGRLTHINGELLLRVRADREHRAHHDAQLAALSALFAKIASDLAEARAFLDRVANRED